MRGHRASRPGGRVGLATGLAVLTLLAGSAAAQAPGGDLVSRGKYVFAAAAGCGCHTEKGKVEPGKTLNAGGRRYDGCGPKEGR